MSVRGGFQARKGGRPTSLVCAVITAVAVFVVKDKGAEEGRETKGRAVNVVTEEVVSGLATSWEVIMERECTAYSFICWTSTGRMKEAMHPVEEAWESSTSPVTKLGIGFRRGILEGWIGRES